jgi:hypothetical protein
MTTLTEVGDLATTQLRERVDTLVSAVESDTPDFAEIASLADSVGELADAIAGIYSDLDRMLTRGLKGEAGSKSDESRKEQAARRERRPREREQSTGDDVTKEELLDRAREVNVQGRSSMSKEELAAAVEAEESVTKEELLERARDADIEGRSAMTKEELRDALRDVGA